MTALLLSGCVNTIFFPPDLWAWESADTGLSRDSGSLVGTPNPASVVSVEGGCDPDGTRFSWEIRTDAWTRSATLNLFRTAEGLEEEHVAVLVAADPEGGWDQLRVGPLADGVPAAEQVAGASTRFDCAEDDGLTAVLRVRDLSDTLTDCVVWGADPSAAVARVRVLDPDLVALGGCRAWEL